MNSSPDSSQPESSVASAQSVSAGDKQTDGETKRVGVLSPHNSKETKAILNAVRTLGHNPIWLRDENVTSRIKNGEVRLSPQVDVLVNRMLLTKSDNRFEDLQLASVYEETTPLLNSPQAVANTLHKYRASTKLAAAGLPVPDAYFARSPRVFEKWSKYLPDDGIHKQTVGTHGDQMAVVSPDEPISPRINDEHSFVQEFLETPETPTSDVRAYVVGDQIVGAMRRHAPEGEWRTNVAIGSEVEGVTAELGEEPRHIAKTATSVLGLDMAGIDMIPIDGEWYILEVNATAGFKGLFSATGVSAAPFIARLAIERAGGGVENSAFNETKSTLNDSVPGCKPPLEQEINRDTLGYTTRIQINGQNGSEQVIAKSDTGAKRTSINTDLAGRIGAGPLVGTTKVRSGTASESQTRPLVNIKLRLNDNWQTVTASITDRSEMKYPVLLGRDILKSYTLDISRTAEE